jgi:hypothetical protein
MRTSFQLARLAVALLAAAAACSQEVGDGGDGAAGSVAVVYGESRVDVDLGTLTAVDVGEGEVHVPLDDVVAAGDLARPLEELEFDFLAGDGFAPRDSPNCTDDLVPVPGANLERGYIHRENRRLFWDAELGYPGCLSVRDTAEILASDLAP